MSSYSNIQKTTRIISESLKLSDILPCCERYLAHTPDETLLEHTELTLKYLDALIQANKLDEVINKLIIGIIPDSNETVLNYVKRMFISTILFHDFGKVNSNFQAEKMKNTLFDSNNDKISSKHSLLGSYIFLVYHLDLINKEINNQEERILLIGFTLLYSFTIIKHHNSSIQINFSDNDIQKHIDELEKYTKVFNFEVDNRFEKHFFVGFNQVLKLSVKLIADKSHNEFNLWALLKLQYSLLTASDYYATNHYKSKLTNIYAEKEFGILNNEQIKKLIGNITTSKEYNQKLLSNFDYYLNIPLSQLEDRTFENLCLLRQKLGAEVIQGIENNIKDRVFYIEAPTGGGKTNLSMLSIMKLLEIIPNEITKIIYVFPFTTLITQTYYSLKESFGLSENEIIQIHSKAGFHSKIEEDNDGIYENSKQDYIDFLFVNYPFCLMSHIKFFDVIKSNNKEINYLLYRLANSVVIIDELQTYSPTEWDKLRYFISHFANTFNIRFILMSATLPKIGNINVGNEIEFTPIIKNVQKRFLQNDNFRGRVSFDWSLLTTYPTISIEELVYEVKSKSYEYAIKKGNVRTIIEFIHKKSTTEFYEKIIGTNDVFSYDEVFVLSGTILEPRRKEIIDYLKDDSNKSKNILLITTQVVEAGVDIDMDLGFKNISLLDSDEQLAGRINRNAIKERCTLYLFKKDEPFRVYKNDFRYDDSKSIYKEPLILKEILDKKNFQQLYDLVIDRIERINRQEFSKNFQDYLENIKNLDFQKTDQNFKLIDADSVIFFVPIDIDLHSKISQSSTIFSSKEIDFLNSYGCIISDVVIGRNIWNLYNSIINNKLNDIIKNKIEFKIISGIMSKFSFSIFKNVQLISDLKPYLEYDEDKDRFEINGYYCFNYNYNEIYDYYKGLDESKLQQAFIF